MRIIARSFVIGLSLVALPLGCSSKEKESAPSATQPETAGEHLDKAKVEAKATARALRDYSYAQKDEFLAHMRQELAELESELARLSAEVDGANAATKAEAKEKLESMREKWTQAKNQLDQAESATEATWDSVKRRVSESYDGLKDSSEESRRWLSEKIDP